MDVKIGDIFSSSWGYDQTNVDYYQVVGFAGKTMVALREIAGRTTETGFMCGQKVPTPGAFKGGAIRKKLKLGYNGNPSVRLNSFSSASKMTPKADGSYESNYVSWYA